MFRAVRALANPVVAAMQATRHHWIEIFEICRMLLNDGYNARAIPIY